MSLNKNIRVCSHIKVNGVRCGSPALRSEVFCYFHQRMIRGVPTPQKSRVHPIAFLEDEEGIQASLMEVVNALVRNTIDLRRAQLVLRALHIAVRNSPRVHFDFCQGDMVRQVPEYPQAPPAPSHFQTALGQAQVLSGIKPPEQSEQQRLNEPFVRNLNEAVERRLAVMRKGRAKPGPRVPASRAAANSR